MLWFHRAFWPKIKETTANRFKEATFFLFMYLRVVITPYNFFYCVCLQFCVCFTPKAIIFITLPKTREKKSKLVWIVVKVNLHFSLVVTTLFDVFCCFNVGVFFLFIFACHPKNDFTSSFFCFHVFVLEVETSTHDSKMRNRICYTLFIMGNLKFFFSFHRVLCFAAFFAYS